MRNIGNRQRLLRGALALALLVSAAVGALDQPWGIALAAAGIVLGITAVTGWCPTVPLLGLGPKDHTSAGSGATRR